MTEPSGPSGGPEEEVQELPEKGPDAARHFAELLEQARRLQRERGFSSKTGEEEDEHPAG
jgi:hypothetical protein